METKTVTLRDFWEQDWELLSELVYDTLRERGINPDLPKQPFAGFSIDSYYTEDGDGDED
jgi:hypothetical protein